MRQFQRVVVEHLFEYVAFMDEATTKAVRRIDDRIRTLTMQYNRLPMRSPSRPQYAGELIGLREARAFVMGEPVP